MNKLEEFICWNNSFLYNIIPIGEFGENIVGTFLINSTNKYRTIQTNINIIRNKRLDEYLRLDIKEFIFVVGDMKEKGTKQIVDKILNKKEKWVYLMLKNYNTTNIEDNQCVINIKNDDEVCYSLESLLYFTYYPSLCCDFSDMWCLLRKSNCRVRRIETNIRDFEKEIKKIDNLNKYKNLHIEVLGGIELELHDITNISKIIQQYTKTNIHIMYHYVLSKKDENKNIKVNLIYN